MGNSKYVVFKRENFDLWLAAMPEWGGVSRSPEAQDTVDMVMKTVPPELEDAVVIRRQDVFAPPALDAYANAIQVVVEVLTNGTSPSGRSAELQKIADYFHTQAQLAWDTVRKLPD